MNLREEIARKWCPEPWERADIAMKGDSLHAADDILAKVVEAVEKVENPYHRENAVESWNEPEFSPFEVARQAILKAIKED